jgi:cell division protein FtsX
MSKTKNFKKHFTEAISKLPSGKILTIVAMAILLAATLYLVILFLFL